MCLCYMYTIELTQVNDGRYDFHIDHLLSPYSVSDGAHGAKPFTGVTPFHLPKNPVDSIVL